MLHERWDDETLRRSMREADQRETRILVLMIAVIGPLFVALYLALLGALQ